MFSGRPHGEVAWLRWAYCLVAAGAMVVLSPWASVAGAETPAERCARETAQYDAAMLAAWQSANPGMTVPSPRPWPPYVCRAVPSTTYTPEPTPTFGKPGTPAPGDERFKVDANPHTDVAPHPEGPILGGTVPNGRDDDGGRTRGQQLPTPTVTPPTLPRVGEARNEHPGTDGEDHEAVTMPAVDLDRWRGTLAVLVGAAGVTWGSARTRRRPGSSTRFGFDRPDGARQDFVLLSDESSERTHRFAIDVPEGGRMVKNSDGSVDVLDAEGRRVNHIRAPWAYDATGRSVSTRYEIDNETGELVQYIDPERSTVYPVLADPEQLGAVEIEGRHSGETWTTDLGNGETATHTLHEGRGTVDTRVVRADGTFTDTRTVSDGEGGHTIWSDNSDGSAAYSQKQTGLGDQYTESYAVSPGAGGRPTIVSEAQTDNSSGSVVAESPDGTRSAGRFERVDQSRERYRTEVTNPDGSTSRIDSTLDDERRVTTRVDDRGGRRVRNPDGTVESVDERGNLLGADGERIGKERGRFYDSETGRWIEGEINPATGDRYFRMGDDEYLREFRDSEGNLRREYMVADGRPGPLGSPAPVEEPSSVREHGSRAFELLVPLYGQGASATIMAAFAATVGKFANDGSDRSVRFLRHYFYGDGETVTLSPDEVAEIIGESANPTEEKSMSARDYVDAHRRSQRRAAYEQAAGSGKAERIENDSGWLARTTEMPKSARGSKRVSVSSENLDTVTSLGHYSINRHSLVYTEPPTAGGRVYFTEVERVDIVDYYDYDPHPTYDRNDYSSKGPLQRTDSNLMWQANRLGLAKPFKVEGSTEPVVRRGYMDSANGEPVYVDE